MTVMNDFSPFIWVWELKRHVVAGLVVYVVQRAVDLTGMADMPVEER